MSVDPEPAGSIFAGSSLTSTGMIRDVPTASARVAQHFVRDDWRDISRCRGLATSFKHYVAALPVSTARQTMEWARWAGLHSSCSGIPHHGGVHSAHQRASARVTCARRVCAVCPRREHPLPARKARFAARRPAPPVPITRTEAEIMRSLARSLFSSVCRWAELATEESNVPKGREDDALHKQSMYRANCSHCPFVAARYGERGGMRRSGDGCSLTSERSGSRRKPAVSDESATQMDGKKHHATGNDWTRTDGRQPGAPADARRTRVRRL